jgi:outer membrane protein assembly factor BamB
VGATSTVPLLLDGKIYLGTDDGSLVCLDAGTGKELWRYATRGAIWHPPVGWGELILFANDADHVYALERATGKWRWQYERETPEEYTVRGHGGVAVAGDRVYAGFADGNLVALAAASGDPVWVRSLAASETQFVDVDTTPVVDGEIIYVASASGGVWAIDAKDGSERWRAPITGASGIAMDGGRLYVTAADEGIHALDLAGHVIWRQGLRGAGDPSEPIISGEYLFFGAASAGLFVVEKRSGKLVQQFNPGFGVSAAPTLGGGRLFVLSNGGVLYAMSVERF